MLRIARHAIDPFGIGWLSARSLSRLGGHSTAAATQGARDFRPVDKSGTAAPDRPDHRWRCVRLPTRERVTSQFYAAREALAT